MWFSCELWALDCINFDTFVVFWLWFSNTLAVLWFLVWNFTMIISWIFVVATWPCQLFIYLFCGFVFDFLFGTHYQPTSGICQHYLSADLTPKPSCSPRLSRRSSTPDYKLCICICFVFKCGKMYVERGDGRVALGDSEWEGVGEEGGGRWGGGEWEGERRVREK